MMLLLLLTVLAQSAPTPDAKRCWRDEVHNDIPVRAYLGDRLCVDLRAARTMSGIWVNAFEGSAFHAGARTIAEVRDKRGAPWLTIDEATALPRAFRRLYGHAYRVTIVGREAVDMHREPLNGYGHMGMSPGLVVADRVIAIEDLGLVRER